MFKGARVVRGRDWAGRNQDGGEGGLGVVIGVSEKKGEVTVVWDTGHEYKYKAGQEGRFELSIFDNGPAGIQFSYITCDSCKKEELEGIRWKCIECHDFDLCTTCYMANKHSLDHPFLRFDSRESIVVPVPSRGKSTRRKLHGILQGASVGRGLHWEWGHQDGGKGNVGKVTDIVKWGSNFYKGGVKVRWANGSINTYRVGGGWRSDLILVEESQNFFYYPDHLPVVDANYGDTVKLVVGDKVRIEVDAKTVEKLHKEHDLWTESMKQYLDLLGTVTRIEDRAAVLQYHDASALIVLRNILTKVHSWKPGDIVRILKNYNAVQELQAEHGGWNDDMEHSLGNLGVVEKIDEDGDLAVRVRNSSRCWTFNPACCYPVDLASLTDAEAELYDELSGRTSDLSLSRSSSSLSDDDTSSDEGFTMDEAFTDLLSHLLVDRSPSKTYQVSGLIEAAAQGDSDMVKSIIQTAPKLVNESADSKTALQAACMRGNKEAAEILIAAGARLNLCDNNGNSPLHHAVSQSQRDMVGVLIKKGASKDVRNKKGVSPIHMAVHLKSTEVIKLLLSCGCQVNTQDEDGNTPLHDAITHCSEEVVKSILENKTVNLSIPNKEGKTALHQAVIMKKERIVEEILAKNSSIVDIKTRVGVFTSLHIASVNGFLYIVNVLLDKGADVNAVAEGGWTALHIAVSRRSMHIIDVLLAAGAHVNAQDKDGNTPSHLVHHKTSMPLLKSVSTRLSTKENQELVADIPYILVQEGADMNIKNKNNKTPLDLFPNQENANMIKRMIREKKKLSTVDLAPPFYWGPMGGGNVTLCPLPCSASEHQKVSRSFSSTMGNRTILKIQRIQNLDRWETFAVLKRQMSKRYAKENKGDQYLFHGTAPASVERIIKQGIDFRLVKRALYGDGAYFARDAKVSDCYTMEDDSGHRFMFMVKVLVGKYTYGEKGIKKPPPVHHSDPDTLYDSVVDNTFNPRIYVVFDNAQCYPEYLIEYR